MSDPATKLMEQMGFGIPDDRVRQRDDGVWQVASRNSPGTWHTVSDSGRCTCEAAEHGRHCWHVQLLTELGKISV